MCPGLKRLKGIGLPPREAEESIGLTCFNLLFFKFGWREYLNAMQFGLNTSEYPNFRKAA